MLLNDLNCSEFEIFILTQGLGTESLHHCPLMITLNIYQLLELILKFIWQDIPEFALQISGGMFQCQPTSKESMKLPYIALYLPSDYIHDLSQIMAVSLRVYQRTDILKTYIHVCIMGQKSCVLSSFHLLRGRLNYNHNFEA